MLVAALAGGCGETSGPEAPAATGGRSYAGVSRELAERRARTLSDVSYTLSLTVPEVRTEPIAGAIAIRFQVSDRSAPVVIDFAQPRDRVELAVVNGTADAAVFTDGQLTVPAAALWEGENQVNVTFTAGDEALNRNDDFLYTLFVPDRASTAFPCFDQPDVKARFDLVLNVPSGWTAVSNGRVLDVSAATGGDRYVFATSEPISTYLFAFGAGRFEKVTREVGGRRMTMYHRESDPSVVARNEDAIFALHATALDWLEDYTGIPYPFDEFEFVAVPSFQYGGMEHPGAIFYRASSLMLAESATQDDVLWRASLIAHETAHMWFGDLVTMRWFDDVWTKEVFANFMAAKIVHPSFPEVRHDLRFLMAHHPDAYDIDRSAGTHPIRQELDNLKNAGTLYGALIYRKSPVVMGQLERILGAERFRDGLRTYLDRNRFGNATWPELIAILDDLTDDDLAAWSHVWVEQAGRPSVQTRIAEGAVRLAQEDPQALGRTWDQQLDVVVGNADGFERVPVRLSGASVDVPAGTSGGTPAYVLANGGGFGYGHFRLDPDSRAYLLEHLPDIDDALVRGVAWVTLWDDLLEGDVDPAAFLELALAALPRETDELNLTWLLDHVEVAFWRFVGDGRRGALAPRLEEALWTRVGADEARSVRSSCFRAFRSTVLTDAGVDRLQQAFRDGKLPGLPLSDRDLTAVAAELVIRRPPGDDVLDLQSERLTNPDARARFDFVRPALSADPAVRERFFRALADPANRAHEPWVLEALGYLHHPLRAASSERFVRPGLDLLEEIQRTGDIFFPKRWLDGTLDGHSSPAAAAAVRRFLDETPDLSPRLRAKVLQSADLLFRAAAIHER